MAMVNMKMSSEESKEYATVDSASEPDAPRYPYGLCWIWTTAAWKSWASKTCLPWALK